MSTASGPLLAKKGDEIKLKVLMFAYSEDK
jgi:hypothetical protein